MAGKPQNQIVMGPKQVLFAVNLNPAQKYGSLEEQIFLLSLAASERGGRFIPVFSRPMDELHALRYLNGNLAVESLDLSKFRIDSFVRLVRMIDRYGINVINWNFYPPANLYVLLIRIIKPAVRHILTDHISRRRSPVEEKKHFWKHIVKRAFATAYSEVFAVSDYIQNDLKGQSIWQNPKRYHHFVNTDRFKPDSEARFAVRTMRGNDHAFVVLVVAYLIPEKGVDVAIQALAKLPADAVLWIIGDGPEVTSLKALALSLGVHDRVSFLGLQADVTPFMQAADCLLCPSLWQEAAGLVILEAMSSGLPVVASDVGGIREFVITDRTGYLVPAGDHLSVVDRVTCLMGSHSLMESMSTSARARAVTNFSHTHGVANALALY